MLRRDFRYAWYTSPWRVKSGRAVVQVWKTEDRRKFLFRFYDDVEFIIDRDQREIWVGGLRGASLQAATHHLLFSLPGFLLGLRKLRGPSWSCSRMGRRRHCACWVSPTPANRCFRATMAARGVDVLSDDLVALDVIDGTVKVYPGYPWICLRPRVT